MTEIQPFTKGWAIVSPKGGGKPWIIWTSVRLTRKEAIESALDPYDPDWLKPRPLGRGYSPHIPT
ncbi:MAG: hypothetical protein PHW65_03190 [Dehalococcoidales bacterium]|nr:hypothetical protein [Dehalococcoidales bacterium]